MKGEERMYDFNLLVSSPWGTYRRAREEITSVLAALGDGEPLVRGTLARGIVGVRTSLDPRGVIRGLRGLCEEEPSRLRYTLKWVPVDLWTNSDLESMREAVAELGEGIAEGESWRMTVEKRRYTRHHKIEIIRDLAEHIDRRVDLENPDKILRIDIMGKYAGISLLEPQDVFSAAKQSG